MNKYIVYYKIDLHFLKNLPKEMNAQEFFSTYKPVEVLLAKGLEDVYYRMQGDIWSPHGEMREFIRILGLSHTSMSVGDAVYSQEEDKFYLVDNFGFEELKLTI